MTSRAALRVCPSPPRTTSSARLTPNNGPLLDWGGLFWYLWAWLKQSATQSQLNGRFSKPSLAAAVSYSLAIKGWS